MPTEAVLHGPMAKPLRNSGCLRFAEFTVDLLARELRKNGSRVRLQDQPFQVLALLMQRAGEVVTREELRQHLWPADTFVDFDNSLNAAIAKIREALADSPGDAKFIETVPRRGYRFIAPVESAHDNVAKPSTTSETSDIAVVGWCSLLSWRELSSAALAIGRGSTLRGA